MIKHFKLIITICVAVLIVNFIGSTFFYRYDATSDKRYTLSQTSDNLLQKIKYPLKIEVYLEGDFPSEFQRLQIETRQFLEELHANNTNVYFEFVNPENSKEKLIKQGMIPTRLTFEEEGKVSNTIIFPWAKLSYGNKSVIAPLLPNTIATSQEEKLQYAISSLEYSFADAIHKITNQKQKKIAVLSGNGELEDKYLYSFLLDVGKKYRMAKFTLDSVAKNPRKTLEKLKEFDLAIIAKPSEKFSDNEKLSLDQFITNGGKTLWMLDMNFADTDSLYNEGKMLAYPRNLNLTDLLFSYGVRVNHTLVTDLYGAKLKLASGNSGNQTQFEDFTWFFHPLAQTNPNHPITKNVLPVRLRFTTQIDTLKNANVLKTPLLMSSVLTKKIGTPAIIKLNSIANEPKQEEYQSGNQLLGVLLEGKFPSAYANRIKPFAIDKFQPISKKNKMIVIADGDIGKNQLLNGKPYDLTTDKWTKQRFGNKNFLLNSIDYLLDDTGLIHLRNKSLQIRLLDKKQVYNERSYWQFLNIIVPLSILSILGIGFTYWRKRNYAKRF